jgi:hypothetical protein
MPGINTKPIIYVFYLSSQISVVFVDMQASVNQRREVLRCYCGMSGLIGSVRILGGKK